MRLYSFILSSNHDQNRGKNERLIDLIKVVLIYFSLIKSKIGKHEISLQKKKKKHFHIYIYIYHKKTCVSFFNHYRIIN
jgi:hypothetical protein